MLDDMVVSYDYLIQMPKLNLLVGGLWNIPAADDKAPEGIGGRHRVGLRTSINGILADSIVWNAGFQYAVGLPKDEWGVQSWEPGNMQGSVGIMTMLNRTIGFGLNFVQSVRLASIRDGVAWRDDMRTASILRPEVIIFLGTLYMRVSRDRSVYPTWSVSPFPFTIFIGSRKNLHKWYNVR
jgi:hypothetical protein